MMKKELFAKKNTLMDTDLTIIDLVMKERDIIIYGIPSIDAKEKLLSSHSLQLEVPSMKTISHDDHVVSLITKKSSLENNHSIVKKIQSNVQPLFYEGELMCSAIQKVEDKNFFFRNIQ